MYFDIAEYQKTRAMFVGYLATFAICITATLFGGFGGSSFVLSLVLLATFGPLAVISGWAAMKAQGRLLKDQEVKAVIDKIMDGLDDLRDRQAACSDSQAEFRCFSSNQFAVFAKLRKSLGYTVTICLRSGNCLEFVVQRYRIDVGSDVGELVGMDDFDLLSGVASIIEQQSLVELAAAERLAAPLLEEAVTK